MSRSLRASEEGIKQIRKAMKQVGWTQTNLVNSLKAFKRSTLTKLLRGEAIERSNFEELCKFLELDWRDIRGEDVVSNDLESLVKEVKQKIAEDVAYQCGTMRVLDTTQALDQIYTDVNIIKGVTGRRRIDYDELIDICTREDVNRFSYGDIEKRISGLDAVEEFKRLMVWGKPGAGKTTFMKYLAMSCLGGKFHSELVPFFVELRFYAAIKSKPTLQEYIWGEFQRQDVEGNVVERLLKEGRALILLDGLDEVKKEDDRRVKQDIEQFSRYWLKNRFAITCRIAAREYQFEKFTEVEVADFDDGQIKNFVHKWFRERDESKAQRMLEKLKDNEPVKELAKSPLLLTLLCLVFGESNDFPPKRSELYKEGLEVLMKKWDAKRNIEREMIYKHLSPQNKEDMLGQIAFNTFVNGEYFFRQEDLQRQINDYICNLPEASADFEALRLDSEVVLKAIEHHHGLLVERARNIYSFSHLTFQEYFAAREIDRERYFETLMQHITDPQWNEVFVLIAEMLRRADDFFHLMKERIDEMLAEDEKLQSFLIWAKDKTDSIQSKYKPAAVRAFYAYVEIFDLIPAILLVFALDLTLDHKLDPNLYLDRTIDLIIDLTIDLEQTPEDLISVRVFNHNLSPNNPIFVRFYFMDFEGYDNDSEINKVVSLYCKLDRAHQLAFDMGEEVLRLALHELKEGLPNLNDNRATIFHWWQTNGKSWRNELRKVCIEQRNTYHNWQFTDDQEVLLVKYYEANRLLIDCMNRSYVSEPVREEIEATMLLPSKK